MVFSCDFFMGHYDIKVGLQRKQNPGNQTKPGKIKLHHF
jgi:hypothetical protein